MSENKSNYLYTVQCVQGNVCRAVYVEQPVHACMYRAAPQGRLTVNYRYTHRKFQLKFSALLKDYDLKYAENSKKNLT